MIKRFYEFISEEIDNTDDIMLDDKCGKEWWFEYHCLESDKSSDVDIWYHSHQKCHVISVSQWSHDTLEERLEDAQPRTYNVRFSDGFECDIFEDELMNSPEEFYRPDPPKRK